MEAFMAATNSSSSSSSAFTTANPHALACILEAAETRSIISATDIFDAQGIKLWAARQPVSAELQRRLADRKLREPLEACLIAEDGVSPKILCEALVALADRGGALMPVITPHLARLLRDVANLTLQPAVQLLLTAAQESRPALFDHAVAAMALNGALTASAGGDTAALQVALLSGLLHDLGEVYIAPHFGEADADRELDFVSYQQLVVHPHVGHLLIKQLTHYPSAIAQAVAEHHEHLDGSGYPKALRDPEISAHGRLLAVTEATLNALRDPYARLLHASVALRAVPGEYDPAWVGQISTLAQAQGGTPAVMELTDLEARLGAIERLLIGAEHAAAALSSQPTSPALHGAMTLATFLLGRVRTGWNESGMWGTPTPNSANAAEVEAIEDELYRRLRGVQRAVMLRAGSLPGAEAAELTAFCDGLLMGTAEAQG
jgi:HD domain